MDFSEVAKIDIPKGGVREICRAIDWAYSGTDGKVTPTTIQTIWAQPTSMIFPAVNKREGIVYNDDSSVLIGREYQSTFGFVQNRIRVTHKTGMNSCLVFGTSVPIDITGYKYCSVTMNVTSYGYTKTANWCTIKWGFGVDKPRVGVSEPDGDYSYAFVRKQEEKKKRTGSWTSVIDISSLTRPMYFVMDTETAACTISEIKLYNDEPGTIKSYEEFKRDW